MVRHPFAVYASHRRAAWNSGRPLTDGSLMLHQMQRSYRETANHLVGPSDSYMILRYEDLLEDTAGSVLRLAAFLGIEALPGMMQPTVNGIPTPSNSSSGTDDVAGRVNRRPPGDALDVLTRHDRECVSAMVADIAEKLDYPLERPLSALRRKRLQKLTRGEWVMNCLKSQWTRFFPN